jgi:hypothetical protein
MISVQPSTYEIKYSKTGHAIPVIDGVHLHSVYNPIKEAEAFASKNEKTIREKNTLLCLGLGFGYHIDQVLQLARKHHQSDYLIAVIDPNKRTVENYHRFTGNTDSRLYIFCNENSEELYKNSELIHILLKSPAILAHPASFNLYQEYFKAFMSYKSPKKISTLMEIIQQEKLKTYFSQFSESPSLDDVMTKLATGAKSLDGLDHLILAFHKLVSYKRSTTSGENVL